MSSRLREDVEVFLPCRAGSERIPRKNTRPFAHHAGGLLERKLDQLAGLSFATRVVLDSNDVEVLEAGHARLRTWRGVPELIVRERPDKLGRSDTTTDSLIEYALSHTSAATLVWTHVTSPFCDRDFYERAWAAFEEGLEAGHDSLMSVTPVRGFIWSPSGPVNYTPHPVRWPRTQDVQPLFDVNSGVFIVPTAIGRTRGDRVGDRPLLFASSHFESIDIDWPEDFEIAEALARHTSEGSKR